MKTYITLGIVILISALFLEVGFMISSANAEETKTDSENFIKKAAELEGAQKTASGLIYILENPGDENAKPTAADSVTVNYEGTLPDGTVFDSSYSRGESVTFPLQRVIAGWTEGLQLVGKGGTIILYIPAELAYGERGAGRLIGPNMPLKFKVELLDIVKY